MYIYDDWGINSMKFLDKCLKPLKTDRNTFVAFVLALITAYLVVDRLIEWVILCFTGVATSYWGAIQYTLSFACVAFAYAFAVPSKLPKSDNAKISFFYVYCVALYILFTSMVVQGVNHSSWLGLMYLPNYKDFFMNFSDLIKPAFTAISIYIPMMTAPKLLKWLYLIINDPIFPNNYKDSILDFAGIDISNPPMETGPYSFEITLCKDRSTGKPVKILENRRFDSTLIVGPSGTGKSSLVIEPMIARDLEKKFFLIEQAKELGYSALKQGLATLNCPYGKEYLDSHFNLNMLIPIEANRKSYISHMGKMIYAINSDGSIVYRNLGLTYVTPDFTNIEDIKKVADNFNIPVHVIDPFDANSIGLNPFSINPPLLCAAVISLILKSLYNSSSVTAELAYMEDTAHQAIQNLVMLIKVMFPRLNAGTLPTLEDLLSCFNNFDLVQSMCEELKQDPELAKEYELQIGYFEQNFYKGSEGRANMKRYIHFAAAQLDVLLRTGAIRDIMCNRTNNIDLLSIIENGEVVLFGTRATDIGFTAHAGFGRFFFMFLTIAAESRKGKETTRIPHFLYVDDFDSYAQPFLSDMFTAFRKFKVGSIFTIPNLSSIGGSGSPLAQTLLSNCSTKLSFGNNTPEDYAWWEKEFGQRREWVINTSYDTSKGKDTEYSPNYGGVKWDWKDTMRVAKIQGLKFKGCIYKIKDKKGKNLVNYGTVDFLESKYKEQHLSKNYNFEKFNIGIVDTEKKEKKIKFDPSNINWGNVDEDVDPIRMNTTDMSEVLNNDTGFTLNFKSKKDNKNV